MLNELFTVDTVLIIHTCNRYPVYTHLHIYIYIYIYIYNTSPGQFTPIHAALLAKSNESHCAVLCMCFVGANVLIFSVFV